MRGSVSVVIPVKNGERYLGELLEAVKREGADETLVIDSGSGDRSVQIARHAGVELLEIAPEAFGHGRTRNIGAERTAGELVCFLTQDATPLPGWLEAYREAFTLDERVGAAYGPQLPRPGTSPMIARELSEFFLSFAPDGKPTLQRRGDPPFLSNVNACYARACWEELRFPEVDYAEDQAFGLMLLAAGWTKVYHPDAAVLHAHEYGPVEFMRRYFDEYRGLRETTGHVEPLAPGATLRHIARSVVADDRWMRKRHMGPPERARWAARSVLHHGGRQAFAALGSRAERLPPRVSRALSLERRAAQAPPTPSQQPLPNARSIHPAREQDDYQAAAEVWSKGSVPLLDPVPGMAERTRLDVAMLIPPFSRGAGGHNTLFQILSRLERRGHVCSVWVQDYHGQFQNRGPAVIRHDIREFFAPVRGGVFKDPARWRGADVVIATGWQTVHPALRLDRCSARVYLVNDHEPDFYPASVERLLAEDTYCHGLHCIAASPWLRDLLLSRYGVTAEVFDLGVDHQAYRPRPTVRRSDTIVYYARHETPRRAVPIGLMALAELHRRRPHLRIALFGSDHPLDTAFPYEHMGILSGEQLSWLYSEATLGLCLSMTNFSLMPKEMLACGLPCVELAGVSAESIFGKDGPLELVALDPNEIANALEHLLDDDAERERRSREGRRFVSSHTWDRAADQVERGLRHALELRDQEEHLGTRDSVTSLTPPASKRRPSAR